MRALNPSMAAACLLQLVIVSPAWAQAGLRWETDLATAQRAALQSNRLLLLHFSAGWCAPCKSLEKNVFNQPGFGATLESSYVAVKLDFDQQKALATQLGVTSIPADVVVTPQGNFVQKFNSPATAEAYVATLQRTAEYARAAQPAKPATPSAVAASSPPSAAPAQTAPNTSTPPGDDRYANHPAVAQSVAMHSPTPPLSHSPPPATATAPSDDRYAAAYAPPPAQSPAKPSAAADAALKDIARQVPAGSPPLALEGCCPVTLIEQRKWLVGDPRWGVVHRGRTYLFGSTREQQRFLANPDQFTPVLSGNDPVLAMDEGKTVPGHRTHGFFYGNRVYMFENEATAQRFAQNPNRYAPEITQAMR